MSKTFLVRIKPELEVDSYNGFTKARGWQGPVDETTANYLKTVKTGDHQPNLPHVFDVATHEEAKVIHEAETTVVSARIGTPTAPIPLDGVLGAPVSLDPPPPPAPSTDPVDPAPNKGGKDKGGKAQPTD
jgi:hypothetical protein